MTTPVRNPTPPVPIQADPLKVRMIDDLEGTRSNQLDATERLRRIIEAIESLSDADLESLNEILPLHYGKGDAAGG